MTISKITRRWRTFGMLCLLLSLAAGLRGASLAAIPQFDVRDYPRRPMLTGLTPIDVATDAQLTAALAEFGQRYATNTHYIRCAARADFRAPRTIAAQGTAAHPLIIAGDRLDGDFTNRAQFHDWAVTGAHVWICGLAGVGRDSTVVLRVTGPADGLTVTQCRFEARRSFVAEPMPRAAQGIKLGWNLFTGNAVNDRMHGDSMVRFETGRTDASRPEHVRIYRNIIETSETGMNDESMCIINRPGMNPDLGPIYFRDFLVLENWIKSGRRRGVYLKHGGFMVRNVCELTGQGLVFAFRGRGSTSGLMLGNIGIGGSSVNVQGEYEQVLGNDFSRVPVINVGCHFHKSADLPMSISDGADHSILAGNSGTIVLGTHLSIATAKLTDLTIEAHRGVVKTVDGKRVRFDAAGHPIGHVPNVDNATVTWTKTTTRLIPAPTTLTREQCGPAAALLPAAPPAK